MTNKEACNVLKTLSNLVNVSNGWEDSAKSSVNEAVLKAIEALIEKEEREQKALKLKEQHRNKCGDCQNFCYGYGGLATTCGHCEILDAPFTDNRSPKNRACKKFIKEEA